MAFTLFSDVVFDSELFMEYITEMNANPTVLLSSGIIRNDPQIEARIQEGSDIVSVPTFKPLSGDSQNYNGTDITVNSISSVKQTAVIIGRANSWGSQDLAAELASTDPVRAIAAAVTKYWQEDDQKHLIRVLTGVFAAANMTNHVTDIAIEDGDAATDANLIGEDTIIDAIQKAMGDNLSKIGAMSFHSVVYSRLLKLNLIDFTPLAGQSIVIPRFLGKPIIVDDEHPVVAGSTSGNKYTSYLYGRDAIGFANGKVKVPVETDREPLLSGGREYLVNRKRYVMHPYGMQWTSSSYAGTSPTNAELVTAANWTRVYEDKNVPLVKLVTNG
jgi:hypothetical protein